MRFALLVLASWLASGCASPNLIVPTPVDQEALPRISRREATQFLQTAAAAHSALTKEVRNTQNIKMGMCRYNDFGIWDYDNKKYVSYQDWIFSSARDIPHDDDGRKLAIVLVHSPVVILHAAGPTSERMCFAYMRNMSDGWDNILQEFIFTATALTSLGVMQRNYTN